MTDDDVLVPNARMRVAVLQPKEFIFGFSFLRTRSMGKCDRTIVSSTSRKRKLQHRSITLRLPRFGSHKKSRDGVLLK